MKLKLTLLLLFSTAGLAFADIGAVCPNWSSDDRSANIGDWYSSYEQLTYGYHVDIELTSTPLANQKVQYIYIDTTTNKMIYQGEAQNNHILFDDTNFKSLAWGYPNMDPERIKYFCNISSIRYCPTDHATDSMNRKLIIWGLDYKGYKVATQINLNLNLDNIHITKGDDIVDGLFGLSGNYSFTAKQNLAGGFKVEQANNNQLSQGGCGYRAVQPHLDGTPSYFIFTGNLNPQLIINVTGNLQYQLDHFSDYTQGFNSETKSYTLDTTKIESNS